MALKQREILFACVGVAISSGFLISCYQQARLLGYAFALGVAATLVFLTIPLIITVRDRSNFRAVDIGLCGALVKSLSPSRWPEDLENFTYNDAYKPKPLFPSSFVVSAALDDILRSLTRDLISNWYRNISINPKFANEVDFAIRTAIGRLGGKLWEEDFVDILVNRIVPVVTNHLKDFDEAERAVRGRNLSRTVTESEELDIAIATRYREGDLHAAASSFRSDKSQAQQEHLRKLVVDLLPGLLPANASYSRAVSALIQEIVACGALYPLIEALADPDTWNQLMEAYGRIALHDRKTVRKLRAALDQHTSDLPRSNQSQAFPRLSSDGTERDFERFVRAIRRCNNLSDARRFRSYVASQLKRESMFESQDQVYLRRLETGKRVLDEKVAKLSASGGHGDPQIHMPNPRSQRVSTSEATSLVDVMHSAAGLSYFMEYMERLHLLPLVQFWIIVDGFRNPLEDDMRDDSGSNSISWTAADRNDIILISENHLSKPELKIPEESRNVVRGFIDAGRGASGEQYRKARMVILATQSSVLEEMQNKYYPTFKQSDLYYKYLASDEAAVPASVPSRGRGPDIKGHGPRSLSTHLRRTPSQSSYNSHRSGTLATEMLNQAYANDGSNIRTRSSNTELSLPFGNHQGSEAMEGSTHSIGQNSQTIESDVQTNRIIENMEAALNDIIMDTPNTTGTEQTTNFPHAPNSPLFLDKNGSVQNSVDRTRSNHHNNNNGKPSIASLGLVETSSRIGVFTDDDLFLDQKKFIEDEYVDPDVGDNAKSTSHEIHKAVPGDLGLTEAISALTTSIEKLISQETIVDALTRKAELTNNTVELRVLSKSKSSLQRELHRKEMQRQQYIAQESDNSLYGRSTVLIKSVMVGKEADGREYALYLIGLERKSSDQVPAASWAVPRRYSEFHELHQRLRTQYPAVRNLEFPGRRMVMKLQKDFLRKRRAALETYLQNLLLIPEVCHSRDLRSFLSQRAIVAPLTEQPPRDDEAKDIITRIYNSVTDGMDDFLGNNTVVLDQLSEAGQNLISAAAGQLNPSQPGLSAESAMAPTAAAVAAAASSSSKEAEAEVNAFKDRDLVPFVKPICDMLLQIFELNKDNNWLRGRAMVVVLHQLLGGTIERKVRDGARAVVDHDALLRYISLVKDALWHEGKLRARKQRLLSEQMKSHTEASVMLATLIPEFATSVVGHANAQAAARRIFVLLNNQRLNLHLMYTILDEVVAIIYGK